MDIKIKRPTVTIEAVVTRANGKIEKLGVIADRDQIIFEKKQMIEGGQK